MRRLLLILASVSLLAAASATPAPAAFDLKGLSVSFTEADGAATTQAGVHPFAWTIELAVETKPGGELPYEIPDGSPRNLTITAPPGAVASPTATQRCTTLEFLEKPPACPLGSQIGITDVTFNDPETTDRAALYNLVPPPGVVAKFGFAVIDSVPVTIEASLAPDPPYSPIAELTNISQALPFYSSTTTLWGNPADPAHNPDRDGCVGECAAGLPDLPFLTVPRACEGTLTTLFEATPWEDPALTVSHEAQTPGLSGCSKLDFAPEIEAKPTSKAASSPTGLDFDVEIDDEGLRNPDGTADSDIKKTVVTLAEGITANPSLAEGLAACSPAQFAAEALHSEPGQGCPEASKIGSLEAETPLLADQVLKGQIFVATQGENPFNSLLALYIVIRDRELGVLTKVAGRVQPDPKTGQITTILGEPGHELPQVPLSRVHVHLREGARSPLISPPLCGTYETRVEFVPWANPDQPLVEEPSFEVTHGVGGGPCPSAGTPPFDPGFAAGSITNDAGSHTPFHMRLTRRDGDQDLTRFSAKLPPGVTAKLAGVGQCPPRAIAAAKAKSGRSELARPSCPPGSEIGDVAGGAGVGSQLIYVPGKIYLAGPHNGAPLSVVAIVPAVAGPFDVGTVVTQQAIAVDPRTAEVRVDGSRSDPIPHILAGIPLRVRDIHVNVDRPDFTLNPTSCEPSQTLAEIWGGGLDVFGSADDTSVNRAARFQAANCASLPFKPKLSLNLKGGTRRGENPALRSAFAPRAGDANLKGLVLRFPRSAFLDQAHIRTICTRVQFAADACPSGAVYGSVRAFTPLLEDPLEGPLILRSSDHELPDIVFDLHGLVDFEAVARVDSVRGGIRIAVQDVPDAPITKVVVEMQGGQKGLIVNSRNLCASRNRARLSMRAHNAKRHRARPVVKARGCPKGRGGKRR